MKQFFNTLFFLSLLSILPLTTQADENQPNNFFGGGFEAAYSRDELGAFGCIFANCEVPSNAFAVGGFLEYSHFLGVQHRWAFRPVIGYERMVAHSEVNSPIPSKTTIQTDLLFDYYFKKEAVTWHPYFSVGPGMRYSPGFLLRPVLLVALGTFYDLGKNYSLQAEGKAATLLISNYLELNLGIVKRF